jgi:N-methylhydantoinase A
MEWAADLRYEGQSYELTVPVARAGPALTAADVAAVVERFHALHRRIYAYGEPSEPVEFVSLRLAAIGQVPAVRLPRRRTATSRPASKAERPVHFPALGRFVPTQIYERADLRPGQSLAGPCLIEETTSTTVVPPGCSGALDAYGCLVIDVRPAARRARPAANGHRRRLPAGVSA